MLSFNVGDQITFKPNGYSDIQSGVIVEVDHSTRDDLPYYVESEGERFYWIREVDVLRVTSISQSQLDRIEAKLDAIIKHLGTPFDE